MGTVMSDPDTGIGGNASAFPATHNSAVRAIASPDSSTRSRGYERLIAAYWKPVYKYIRIKWRMNNEDAKDLTQSFFTRAIEKRFFYAYDVDKGAFRTYLRICLDRFLSNEREHSRRLKRSGELAAIDMDFDGAESEVSLGGGSSTDSFESYFEKEWTRALFSAALAGLREDCRARGKEIQTRLFERYDLEDDDPEISYAQLAGEFGISATDVTNHLASARRAFRRILIAKLREITATEREFRSEARLLGIEV
jgi:RNA polymerase sigma factor (sigma-70 family)